VSKYKKVKEYEDKRLRQYKMIATINNSDYYYNGKRYAEVKGYHLINVRDREVLSILEKIIKGDDIK